MVDTHSKRGRASGCYYRRASYGSAWARCAALLIDFAVVGALFFAAVIGATSFTNNEDKAIAFASVALLLFGWLYLIELERSRFGTLGFRLLNLEIVNLKGERPSRSDMAFRLCMSGLGPFNVLIDLLWIHFETNKQAIRDKFAGTYVIKRGATPEGYGAIMAVTRFMVGINWVFREVRREPQPKEADR